MTKPSQQTQRLLEAATHEFRPELRRFLQRWAQGSYTVQDLAQEVLLRLLRFPPEDVVRHPKAYLFRVASNVARDFGLRERQLLVSYDSELDDRSATTEQINDNTRDIADRISDEQEVERALAQLPAPWRATLLLRYRDGYSYEEIAEQFGASVDAVSKYAARGLERIRLHNIRKVRRS